MTENQSSSSLSIADLDLSLKRISVKLWILDGCDDDKPLLLKQDGCLGCFNREFDRVIGDLPFTDDELARVYMAGLKDEIAASLHSFRPISLLEAIDLAQEATKVVAKRQEVDGSSLSTQEVQEKSLEDQESCGSSQEDSVGKEILVLKQYGSIVEFNLDFDLVTSDLTLTEEELVCVYIDGLDDEIAAPGRLLWPRTLREAKHQACCHEFLIETQDSRAYDEDNDVLWIFMKVLGRWQLKVRQKRDLMNIKLSYSNETIKQRLEELQNIKDNLIPTNPARKKKNLRNICVDCMDALGFYEKKKVVDEE